jgi:hypothetical protein
VPLRLDFRRSRTRRKTSQIGFVGGSGALLPGAADVSKIFTNGNQVFSSVKLNQVLIVLA